MTQVELWKIYMQGQFWKWRRRNLKTGKDEDILVQGSLRPTILGAWEYVFPEECLTSVLSIMFHGEQPDADKSFANKTKLLCLRKAFGAKKIPKKVFDEAMKTPNSLIIKECWRGLSHAVVFGVSIHLIGYKKDIKRDFDFTGTGQGKFNQEAL